MIVNSNGEAPPEDVSNTSSSSGGGVVNNKVDPRKARRNRRRRKVLRQTRSLAEELTYDDSSSDLSCSSDSNVGAKRCREDKEGENLHGKVSVIGRRREMEDAVAVELGFMSRGEKGYDFFGVYDGHGGWRVAQACSESLHKMLVMISGEGGEGEIDWARLMDQGFKKMDEEVNRDGGAAVATIGSTAVVAVVGEKEVVVANCGDSRAVLSRGGTAIALSDDHKPDRPDELERIEISGGKVINWNGQRVLGVLATSRSIGDNYMKPFVITEPEVKVINRSDADEFLILASDGLWDVVSNDLACQVARRCFTGPKRQRSQVTKTQDDTEEDRQLDETINESHASRAAAVLAELAMARGSGDNISVIVVKLKHTASDETKVSPSTAGAS